MMANSLIDILRLIGARSERGTNPLPGLLEYTGQNHPATGRPIMRGPDGQLMTEYTMTVQDPRLNRGMFTNIPSIWNGQAVGSDDDAIRYALQSGRRFVGYRTLAEAIAAAKQRSANLGLLMPDIE